MKGLIGGNSWSVMLKGHSHVFHDASTMLAPNCAFPLKHNMQLQSRFSVTSASQQIFFTSNLRTWYTQVINTIVLIMPVTHTCYSGTRTLWRSVWLENMNAAKAESQNKCQAWRWAETIVNLVSTSGVLVGDRKRVPTRKKISCVEGSMGHKTSQ